MGFSNMPTPVVGAGGAIVAAQQRLKNPNLEIVVIDDSGWHLIDTKMRAAYDPKTIAFASTGREVLAWGGVAVKDLGNGGFVGEMLGAGVRIDPVAATVQPMSKVGAPSPRGNPHSIWTGKQLFVWGGA